MVRVPWSSVNEEIKEEPTLPLRPKNDPESPPLEIYPFDTTDGLIVKVQPPRDHPDPNLHHVPCDIVLVIDVSGSMGSDAPAPGDGSGEQMGLSVLDLTKHAAMTIMETLGPQDRMGIVTFASQAQTLQKLVPMDSLNKRRTRANIKKMATQDATNLWHGILSGIKLFEEDSDADTSGRVPAIMVLTDGMPNHMCPAQGYVPKLRSMGRLPANIHTFGFGYSLRSGLLKSIAEVSGGNYAFIPDAGMIGTVFVHAVANLQSTFANNATLKLTYPPYLQLEETTGESVDKQEPLKLGRNENFHSQLTVSLGNLQYGHSREVYLRYAETKEFAAFLDTAQAGEDPDFPPIINAVLEYSRLDSTVHKVVSHRSILDVGQPTLPPAEVAYHISRSAIIELLSHVAPIRAKDGEHVPARNAAPKLASDVDTLLSSIPAASPDFSSDPRCASLLEDLAGEDPKGQISIAVQKGFFTRWGIHYLPSLAGAHARQICNSFKDPGPLMYGTDSPLFIRCRDRLDNAFDRLPAPRPSNKSTYRGTIRMSAWNNSSAPCFAGNAPVAVLGDGRKEKEIKVERLRAGMGVLTPRGERNVVAVLKTRVRRTDMCLLDGGLLVTPWHPVSVDGRGWEFPARMGHKKVRYTGSIYSVLLERDGESDAHAVMVGGVWGVTLGHGLMKAGRGGEKKDVRVHQFLGDYNAVLKSLSGLPRGANGLVLGGGVVRDRKTGLMNGFKRVPVPVTGSRTLRVKRARAVAAGA
ncbi:hint-domain-containing protein [Coniochaeta sp. 2T2.1]|nr:hint-domain-containing protein [Coniochaeta sp. 2T2.1]